MPPTVSSHRLVRGLDYDTAMKRRRLRRLELPGTARFLTFTCYRRLPLLQNPKIADRFAERLTEVAAKLRMSVLCWVIMPNHVHLIVYANDPAVTMKQFTYALKAHFAQGVIKRWKMLDAPILERLRHGDEHRFWQTGGGYDRNLVGKELLEKIVYVHANPIRWDLAERPCDYRWSSAAAYEGLPCIGPGIDFALLPPVDVDLT